MCNIDKCRIYKVQKIIKSKWVVIVIYLLDKDDMKFNELKNSISHISNEQLSKTLRKLKSNDFIDAFEDRYCLTTRGRELAHIVRLMEEL